MSQCLTPEAEITADRQPRGELPTDSHSGRVILSPGRVILSPLSTKFGSSQKY